MSIYFECVLSSRYAVKQEGPQEAVPLTLNPEIPMWGLYAGTGLVRMELGAGFVIASPFFQQIACDCDKETVFDS